MIYLCKNVHLVMILLVRMIYFNPIFSTNKVIIFDMNTTLIHELRLSLLFTKIINLCNHFSSVKPSLAKN